MCLDWGFHCAPPLLAAVLGCVCACVRTPLVPHHSWLGCGVWVCVLGLGFRLRPATSGWGVGVCMFVCAPRLSPVPPGWVVRCGCVCLGSGFCCAPPLLAGVLGGVCACVRALLVPLHSWLGCGLWVCVLGLGLCLRPATPSWGVGGCVCLCARSACTPPLLARVCGVGLCAAARVLAAPRHSWRGCSGVCVLVYALRLYPATPGWGVRPWCVCLGSGFGCAPQLLAGPLGCVCVRVRALLVPRHSWLECAAWVCVIGPGFPLRPATPGWGVGLCVCLCAHSTCTPPILAGVCGVGVGAWARVLAAPRHSWLGCWSVRVYVRAPLVLRHSWQGCAVWVFVFRLGFQLRPATPGWGVGVCVCVLMCALRLYPATPGWGVRCGCVGLGSAFDCAPPLLAGVLGCVCACVRAPLVPRHSWLGCGVWVCVGLGSGFGCALPLLAGVLGCVCACVRAPLIPRHIRLGCAAWVCVFGLGFWMHPATPGWGVGLRVCLCARSACTPPVLARVCGVGVGAWARVSAAPRHSWLGCWGVCALVCALRLHPATPCWAVRRGCVCLGSGLGCAPPLLGRVLGCFCGRVRAPLVPRHSLLECAVWVCVFGLGFRLRPASPGRGVEVFVFVCALRLYPATPGWGFVVCGLGVAGRLFLCRGSS